MLENLIRVRHQIFSLAPRITLPHPYPPTHSTHSTYILRTFFYSITHFILFIIQVCNYLIYGAYNNL